MGMLQRNGQKKAEKVKIRLWRVLKSHQGQGGLEVGRRKQDEHLRQAQRLAPGRNLQGRA